MIGLREGDEDAEIKDLAKLAIGPTKTGFERWKARVIRLVTRESEEDETDIAEEAEAYPIEKWQEYYKAGETPEEFFAALSERSIAHTAAEELVDEHGSWVLELIDNEGGVEEAQHALDHKYEGRFEDEEDYGRQMAGGMDRIPDWLEGYIDYEKMGKDFLMDKTVYADGGCIRVFGDR